MAVDLGYRYNNAYRYRYFKSSVLTVHRLHATAAELLSLAGLAGGLLLVLVYVIHDSGCQPVGNSYPLFGHSRGGGRHNLVIRMPVDMAPGLYGPWLIWPIPGRYGPASQWIWPIFDITERFALIMPKRPKYLIYSRTKINIHEHRTIDNKKRDRPAAADAGRQYMPGGMGLPHPPTNQAYGVRTSVSQPRSRCRYLGH